MRGLTLQVSENPPELPKMSDIIIHTPPPNSLRPRPTNPGNGIPFRSREGANVPPFSSRWQIAAGGDLRAEPRGR
jgi:hypothetical protein